MAYVREGERLISWAVVMVQKGGSGGGENRVD